MGDGVSNRHRDVTRLQSMVPFLLFPALAILFARRLLLTPGLISGLDWAFPPTSSQSIYAIRSIEYAWTSIGVFSGEPSLSSLTAGNWYFLGYVASLVGMSTETYSKLSLLFLLSASGISMFFLLQSLKLNMAARLVGSIAYMTSPIFVDWITLTGMGSIASTYALLPAAFYFFNKSISRKNSSAAYSILAGFALAGLYPVFGIALGLMLLLPYMMFKLRNLERKRNALWYFRSLGIAIAVAAGSQFFWILSLFAADVQSIGVFSTQTLQLNAPINSLRLFGSYLPAYENFMSMNAVTIFLTFLPPAFVFLPIAIKNLSQRSKDMVFFAALAVAILLFVTSSVGAILIQRNVAYLGIFRDTSKLLLLAAISYGVLLSFHTDSLLARVKSWPQRIIVCVLILLVLLPWAAPYIWGIATEGFISNVSFPSSYDGAYAWLSNKSADSKALWLPLGGLQVRSGAPQGLPWTIDFYSIYSSSGGLSTLSNRFELIPQFWLSNFFYKPLSLGPPNVIFDCWSQGLPCGWIGAAGEGLLSQDRTITFSGASLKIEVPQGGSGKWLATPPVSSLLGARYAGFAVRVDGGQSEIQFANGNATLVYSFSAYPNSTIPDSANVRFIHTQVSPGMWTYHLVDVLGDWLRSFGLPERFNSIFVGVRGEGVAHFDSIESWQSAPRQVPNQVSGLSKLLGMFSVKYVVDRRDVQVVNWGTALDSEIWGRGTNAVPIDLRLEPGLSDVQDFGNVSIFENSHALPAVFTSASLAVASGDLGVLHALSQSAETGLDSEVIVFASQESDPSLYSIANRIIVQNNDNIDLFLPYLQSARLIDPGNFAGQSSINNWSNLHQWDWASTYQDSLEGVAFIRQGTATLSVPGLNVENGKDRMLWVKLLFSPQGSNVSFSLSSPTFSSTINVNTLATLEGFRWVNISGLMNGAGDTSPSTLTLSITNYGGENAIARVVSVRASDFNYAARAIATVMDKLDVQFLTTNSLGMPSTNVLRSPVTKTLGTEGPVKPDIALAVVDPTKYAVGVKNALNPFFLVLSQTYNKNWQAQINGNILPESDHFVAYGFANAWYVPNTGSFSIVVSYGPQRVLQIGQLVSISVVAISLSYMFYYAFKKGLPSAKKVVRYARLEDRSARQNR